MHRAKITALFSALLLFLLTPAPVTTAEESAVTAALDLAAAGKVKKARKAFEEAADDPTAAMLAELFAAYSTKDSALILRHFWKAEDRARDVPPQRLEDLLTRVRERRASADPDTPIHQLACHLRTLHPSLSDALLPEKRQLDEKVSGDVRAPGKRFLFEVPYPEELGTASGVVVTQAEIDEEGCLVGAKVIETFAPAAERAVLDAAEWYVFDPARLGGAPVRVYYNFTSNFVGVR